MCKSVYAISTEGGVSGEEAGISWEKPRLRPLSKCRGERWSGSEYEDKGSTTKVGQRREVGMGLACGLYGTLSRKQAPNE